MTHKFLAFHIFRVLRCTRPSLVCVCVSDTATGELRISNNSQSLAGLYLSEVGHAVGAERCRIALKANKCKEFKQDVHVHVMLQDEHASTGKT